jgi:hypothetical protein
MRLNDDKKIAREIFDALKALLHKPFGARQMRWCELLRF